MTFAEFSINHMHFTSHMRKENQTKFDTEIKTSHTVSLANTLPILYSPYDDKHATRSVNKVTTKTKTNFSPVTTRIRLS
jgi:hypothetical protein